jgi:hypothetical protein
MYCPAASKVLIPENQVKDNEAIGSALGGMT